MCRALCLHMLIRFSQPSRLVILSHFIDEETEAQRADPACPPPQSSMVAELSLDGVCVASKQVLATQRSCCFISRGRELDGIVEPVSEGGGPRALARLRGDPRREVEGAGATFSEEASPPGSSFPSHHLHPSPSFFSPSPSVERRLKISRPRFRGWVRALLFGGVGFTLWKWKLMLSGKTPSFAIKTGISLG